MSENVTSLQDIARALDRRNAERPIYVYQVPKSIADVTGVTSIGLVELTPNEMLRATRATSDQREQMVFEMAKLSWRQINGKAIHVDDDTSSAEEAWACSKPGWAKLRTLVTQAYNRINNPSKEENDAFLASESVTVGQ